MLINIIIKNKELNENYNKVKSKNDTIIRDNEHLKEENEKIIEEINLKDENNKLNEENNYTQKDKSSKNKVINQKKFVFYLYYSNLQLFISYYKY